MRICRTYNGDVDKLHQALLERARELNSEVVRRLEAEAQAPRRRPLRRLPPRRRCSCSPRG